MTNNKSNQAPPQRPISETSGRAMGAIGESAAAPRKQANNQRPSLSSGPRLIRVREVMVKTGMARPTIYEAMARKDFPQPVRLTARSVAWIEAEIDGWIAERIAARDRAA